MLVWRDFDKAVRCGLKQNSLFGTDRVQTLEDGCGALELLCPKTRSKPSQGPLVRVEDVDVFCDKIRTGKDAQAGFGLKAIQEPHKLFLVTAFRR